MDSDANSDITVFHTISHFDNSVLETLTNSQIQNPAYLHFLNPPFQSIHSQAKNESPYTLSHISQVTPAFSTFTNERSNNNSPDDTQISYELNNPITLQQQLKHPKTLTIHQLASTITS